MPTTTYTCKYCKESFTNLHDAREHEIRELVKRNPNPIFSITVSMKDNTKIYLSRLSTFIAEDGRHIGYWDVRDDGSVSCSEWLDDTGVWMVNKEKYKHLDKDIVEEILNSSSSEIEFIRHTQSIDELWDLVVEFRDALKGVVLKDEYTQYADEIYDKRKNEWLVENDRVFVDFLKNFKFNPNHRYSGFSKYTVELPDRGPIKYGLWTDKEIRFHQTYNVSEKEDDGGMSLGGMVQTIECPECKKKFTGEEFKKHVEQTGCGRTMPAFKIEVHEYPSDDDGVRDILIEWTKGHLAREERRYNRRKCRGLFWYSHLGGCTLVDPSLDEERLLSGILVDRDNLTELKDLSKLSVEYPRFTFFVRSLDDLAAAYEKLLPSFEWGMRRRLDLELTKLKQKTATTVIKSKDTAVRILNNLLSNSDLVMKAFGEVKAIRFYADERYIYADMKDADQGDYYYSREESFPLYDVEPDVKRPVDVSLPRFEETPEPVVGEETEAKEEPKEEPTAPAPTKHYLMTFTFQLEDGSKFKSADVVDESQKGELESGIAESKSCILNLNKALSFEIKDLSKCVSFQKLGKRQAEMFKKLGIASIGIVGYGKIMTALGKGK